MDYTDSVNVDAKDDNSDAEGYDTDDNVIRIDTEKNSNMMNSVSWLAIRLLFIASVSIIQDVENMLMFLSDSDDNSDALLSGNYNYVN